MSLELAGERPIRGGGGGYSYYRGGTGGPHRGGDRDRGERDQRSHAGGYAASGSGGYGARGGHQAVHSASATSPAPGFDLQAESAFPPLPGLDAETAAAVAAGKIAGSGAWLSSANKPCSRLGSPPVCAEVAPKTKVEESANGDSGAWESKLSDVVKGVVKLKVGSNGAAGQAARPQTNGPLIGSPAASAASALPTVLTAATVSVNSSPAWKVQNDAPTPVAVPNGDLAQSTLALTPPTSPAKRDRTYPASVKQNRHQHSSAVQEAQSATTDASKTNADPAAAAPCMSYAKMAEQNKERLEQLAREVKEREREQERERKREREQLLRANQTSEYCIA